MLLPKKDDWNLKTERRMVVIQKALVLKLLTILQFYLL